MNRLRVRTLISRGFVAAIFISDAVHGDVYRVHKCVITIRRCCFFERFSAQLEDIEFVAFSDFYFQEMHGLKFMAYVDLHYRIYG
jgi:hypothetical protein